jgi:hypothetical protein
MLTSVWFGCGSAKLASQRMIAAKIKKLENIAFILTQFSATIFVNATQI